MTDFLSLLYERVTKQPLHDIARQYAFDSFHPEESISAGTLLGKSAALSQMFPTSPSPLYIVVWMDRSIDYCISLVSVWMSGNIFVPIDPSTPNARTIYLLNTLPSKQILVLHDGNIPDLDFGTMKFPDSLSTIDFLSIQKPSTSPAYVCFTSGTSGIPKGVLVGHSSLSNVLHFFSEFLKPSNYPTSIPTLTPQPFDIAFIEILLPLITFNCILDIFPSALTKSPSTLAKLLASKWNSLALVQATPTAWNLLVPHLNNFQASVGDHSRFPVILCGGEAMSFDLAKSLSNYSEQVYNCYGPTECTIWCSVFRITQTFLDRVEWGKSVPIGIPLKGVSFLSSDHDQLLVQGNLALGYIRESELEPFEEYYSTGDRVKKGEFGWEWKGRIDRQLKLRGHRIEPGDIESVLSNMKCIQYALVDLEEEALVLSIVSPSSVNEILDKVRRYALSHLPSYMVPSKIRRVELFQTPNGKLDRQKMLQSASEPIFLFSHSNCTTTDSDSIPNYIESEIQSVLGAEVVLNISLVSQGLHSLQAMILVQRLSQRLAITIDVEHVFAHKTTKSFIEMILEMIPDSYSLKPLKKKKCKKHDLHPFLKACSNGALQNVISELEKLKNPDQAKDRFGSTGLCYASGAGHLAIIQHLVNSGASITLSDKKSGRQSFHWAARHGRKSVCSYLLQHGATIDIQTQDGTTPLQLAAWGGHAELCKWLEENGANIQHVNRWGCYVSHFAALSGSLSVVQWLFEIGFDLSLPNDQGHNTLHKAAYGGHESLCKLLVELGMDTSLKDIRGQTPSMLAKKAGHTQLSLYLS